MTGPLLARRLARVLSRDLPEDAPEPGDRDVTVRRMQQALRTRRVRRAQARWLGGLTAAAALALATFGVLRHHPAGEGSTAQAPAAPAEVVVEPVTGGVLVLSGGHTNPLVNSKAIATGDHVLALFDGEATIALATGTRLSVAGGGDVALLSSGATQIFQLGAGSVRADVAKLHSGERFVIRTLDAEIEVRGTSFRVATAAPDPACGNGTTTRVNVFEGMVKVRFGGSEAAIHPGESWPADCGDTSVGVLAASSSAAGQAGVGVTTAQRTAALPAMHSPATASELAAENDLFDQAMLAKRRGDLRGAVASFDRLLSRYPACPFAESAAAERMKLLGEMDPARAADLARDYLRRYPSGFAAGDAKALLH